MLVDFTKKIKNFNDEEEENTFRNVAVNALNAQEQGLSGSAQMDKFDLAYKIHKSTKAIEINKTEQELIQRNVEKVIAVPIITKRFSDLLKEPEVKPTTKK